jgi:hypothetical protein
MDSNKKEIVYTPTTASTKPEKKSRSARSAVSSNGGPSYGCLKGGKIPTYKQFTRRSSLQQPVERSRRPSTTFKHYRKCGKIQNNTVRVLLADQKMMNGIERDKKKLEKHSLAAVCDYLAKRNLYSAGSDVPEDILREIYRNAHLAGNVHNHDSDIMINNFLKGGEPQL